MSTVAGAATTHGPDRSLGRRFAAGAAGESHDAAAITAARSKALRTLRREAALVLERTVVVGRVCGETSLRIGSRTEFRSGLTAPALSSYTALTALPVFPSTPGRS
jgi:hypothetical protein